MSGVAKQLSTEGLEELRPIKHTVIVPISGIHRGVVGALQYAKSIAPEHVRLSMWISMRRPRPSYVRSGSVGEPE
jgi:hypothetical protein